MLVKCQASVLSIQLGTNIHSKTAETHGPHPIVESSVGRSADLIWKHEVQLSTLKARDVNVFVVE